MEKINLDSMPPKLRPVHTVLEEVMPLKLHIFIFAIFLVGFTFGAYLLYANLLPSSWTYEVVFGPVILVGYYWFLSLLKKAYQQAGKRAILKYITAFILMFLLANFVDFTLIKLGAWNFNNNANLCNVVFPTPLAKNVHGEPISVPLVEIFGFNGSIAWFIYFCGVILNRIVKAN